MLKKINLDKINLIYICFMTVYMSVREVLPLNFLIDSTAVSAVIFALGAVIIAADLFTKRKCLEGHMQDLLIVFLAVCCISSVINYKLGIFDNVKFIAALAIEYLIFFCFAKNSSKEEKSNIISTVSYTLIITWFILNFLSVMMYFLSVDITVTGKGTWGITNQGFSTEYTRLWGIMQDPNYAGPTSIVAAFAALRLIMLNKKVYVRILLGISIAFNVIYIVLGGSRSGLLLLIAATAIYAAYRFILPEEKQDIKSTLLGLGKSILTVLICVLVVFGTKTCLPYAKAVIFNGSSFEKSAVSAYSRLYSLSGLEFSLKSPSLNIDSDDLQEPVGDDDSEDDASLSGDSSETSSEDTSGESSTDSSSETGTSVSGTEDTSENDGKKPGNNIVVTPLNRTDLEKEDVSNGRLLRWKQTVEIFLNAPIFGTSPRNLTLFARINNPDTIIAKFAIAPHNGYLDVLVETGIAGFLVLGCAFALALFTVLRRFFKARFSEDRAFLLLSVIIFAGLAVFISDIYMVFSINSMFFWLLLGLAFNYDKKETAKGFINTLYSKTAGKLIDKISEKKGS